MPTQRCTSLISICVPPLFYRPESKESSDRSIAEWNKFCIERQHQRCKWATQRRKWRRRWRNLLRRCRFKVASAERESLCNSPFKHRTQAAHKYRWLVCVLRRVKRQKLQLESAALRPSPVVTASDSQQAAPASFFSQRHVMGWMRSLVLASLCMVAPPALCWPACACLSYVGFTNSSEVLPAPNFPDRPSLQSAAGPSRGSWVKLSGLKALSGLRLEVRGVHSVAGLRLELGRVWRLTLPPAEQAVIVTQQAARVYLWRCELQRRVAYRQLWESLLPSPPPAPSEPTGNWETPVLSAPHFLLAPYSPHSYPAF